MNISKIIDEYEIKARDFPASAYSGFLLREYYYI